MKLVQKLCMATVVSLAAVTGGAKPLSSVGTLIAPTGDVPPVNSAPGTPGRPGGSQTGDTMQKDDRGAPAPTTPAADKRSDDAITMKVKAELLAAEGLNSSGIQVSTKNGVVHLGGKVKNDRDRLTALNTARSVAGVSTVKDGMQVAKSK